MLGPVQSVALRDRLSSSSINLISFFLSSLAGLRLLLEFVWAALVLN